MLLQNKKDGRVIQTSHKQRIVRMRRRVCKWANLLKSYTDDKAHYQMMMITLTYRDTLAWSPYDISRFMLRVKTELGSSLMAYAWVGEMQARGAVHYHVILVTSAGVRLPKPDNAGWWPYGMTRVELARTPFYLVKYVGKEHQRDAYPVGMRIFAIYVRHGVLTDAERWELMVTALPGWLAEKLRAMYGTGAWVKRLKGGGYQVGKAGSDDDYDELESDWVVLAVDSE